MSELILALHTNFHDASAALYEDYELRAAVQLERLTRHKGDGRQHPDLAIDEVLAIAGATRRDIDAVALGRMLFPFEYFRNISGTRWLHWQYRKHVQGNARRHMMAEILRYRGADDAVFDAAKFRRASGLRADTRVISTITTSRMRSRRCSTRHGTTRCWSRRMPAATPSTTATAYSRTGS